MESNDVRTRDDSAAALLKKQNNLKQQPTLAGYIPSTMAPENSPFQNGALAPPPPAPASAPLTESALRQLQQAQAEEAHKQQLEQLQHLRGGGLSSPNHTPPMHSPLPPGSPAATVSSAGGGGGGNVDVGIDLNNSLSQQSPFAFAAQQQMHQHLPSRDLSGGSHLSQQPGEQDINYGAVSPRSGQSVASSAAGTVVNKGAVNSSGSPGGSVLGVGRGAGSPTPPPSLYYQPGSPPGSPAAAAAAVEAALQYQQQQQQVPPQNAFNLPVVPEYHHMASSMWSGTTQQQSHQQRALADAAVSAQRLANQKVLEQQHAAAVASQAATTVAAADPSDIAHRAQAALTAVQAQSVYEIASQDAINAQNRATQLQQAALTASLQPVAAAATTTTAAGNALLQMQQQQQQFAVPAQVAPPAAVAAPPPVQPSPLAQAAVAAKQTAAQKHMESQAAANAYQNAAVQAASAIEPSHVAVANAVAQQAAMMYQTAVNEAVNAAATAAHLEQAAATAAVAATVVPPTAPFPASMPLAAQIAAGATLQQPELSYATLHSAQQQAAARALGALPSPPFTAAATAPSPGFTTTAAQQLQQMHLLQSYPGITTTVPAVTTAAPPIASPYAAATPSGLFVTPTLLSPPTSSVLGMSISESAAQSSLSSGMQSSNLTSDPHPALPAAAPPALQIATAPPPPAAVVAASPLFHHQHQQQQQQQQQQRQSPSPPPTVVKAVCSSGGSFIRGSGGAWDYEGGETRLINIPYGCSAGALFATLERATSSLSDSSEISSEYNPTLKYRLPSDPNVWVDLVDDDDVELMFDEWQDACLMLAAPGGGGGGSAGGAAASPTYAGSTASAGSQSSSCKLHLYVQWRRPTSSLGEGSAGEGRVSGGAASSGEDGGGPEISTPRSADPAAADNGNDDDVGNIQVVTPESNNQEGEAKKEEEDNNETTLATSDAATTRRRNRQRRVKPSSNATNNNPDDPASASTFRHHHNSSIDLPDLIERMEIIQPSDISLVKFLGSGGYGDVYLGRWHGCEVAVKCLNPALFFQGGGAGGSGEPGSINRAAVTDLIKEADMLGSLRHPNVVWVYGIVLPATKPTTNRKNTDSDGDNDGFTGSDDSDGDGDGGTQKHHRQQNIIDVIQAEAGTPSMMPGILRPPALVTEYMAGGSLKVALARKADIVAGPLTRVVLALDAAKGVEYLHSKRLVHFDLKSGNLLLGYRDRRPICKVADFGLAREKQSTFVSGVTCQRGTLPWVAPEILRTPEAVTEAADVYSFGVVLWELWTGREPWENMNFHALMLQLANPEIKLRPPIPGTEEWDGPEGSAPPELAPGWRDLMERCWEEDPNNRPPFTQIVKELRAMISAIRPPRSGRGEGIGGGNGIHMARGR